MDQLDLFGPPTVTDQGSTGEGWFAIRDYGHRTEGLQEGTSAFLSFQSTNGAGHWGDWVLLNGGLISREPGNEQGDLDLIIYVNGRIGGFAITGDMQAFGGPGPGLVPIVDGQMNLGGASTRINRVYCKELVIETVGKQIQINGTWQWVDCIPVRTQQGLRWIPTYAAHEGVD